MRKKLAELQKHLRELETAKTEQENLQIIQLVPGLNMKLEEFAAFLRGGALQSIPSLQEEEPTTGGMEPEGVPVTPEGNATLVDDFYGDKQLITVTT